ncbi:unnamed protein product [Strongylus vulgaris]|uniref:Uncharacterized protein n=1 Tax=Strongylus vulgaris TaxID=40348 RepID=A0A3P7I7E2_STRVU|nr:unnamed protein product [Strongylus vulgaris]
MTPAYPAQTPHPIVYSTTPVTSMPTVQMDGEAPDTSQTPNYPAAYLVPVNAPYGSLPQQVLVPAPVCLTR